MGKLHENLAAEPALRQVAEVRSRATLSAFANEKLFAGAVTETRPLVEHENDPKVSPEKITRPCSDTVVDALRRLAEPLRDLWHQMSEKEATNQVANADVVVDGTVIAQAVPATLLLSMEKQLASLRDVVAAVPVADGSVIWEPTEWNHVRKSPTERRLVTEKVQESSVVVEPTREHPGQYHVFTRDTAIGEKLITALDGRATISQKRDWLRHIDGLIRAVREARSTANHQVLVQDSPGVAAGKAFADYLFNSFSAQDQNQ